MLRTKAETLLSRSHDLREITHRLLKQAERKFKDIVGEPYPIGDPSHLPVPSECARQGPTLPRSKQNSVQHGRGLT
jgi:hypothetical protein